MFSTVGYPGIDRWPDWRMVCYDYRFAFSPRLRRVQKNSPFLAAIFCCVCPEPVDVSARVVVSIRKVDKKTSALVRRWRFPLYVCAITGALIGGLVYFCVDDPSKERGGSKTGRDEEGIWETLTVRIIVHTDATAKHSV